MYMRNPISIRNKDHVCGIIAEAKPGLMNLMVKQPEKGDMFRGGVFTPSAGPCAHIKAYTLTENGQNNVKICLDH